MRTNVTEAAMTSKLCLLCRCTNNVSVLTVGTLPCDLWRLQRTGGCNCHQSLSSAIELPPPHLPSYWSEYSERMHGMLLCEWESQSGSVWGGGRTGWEGGSERDCSVVVYVSLRSCVGRSAPSRHCCCCQKDRTKDPPCCGPLTPLASQLCYDPTLMECY